MIRVWKHRHVWILAAIALLAVLAAAGWCFIPERSQVFTLEPHDDSLYLPVTFGGSTHLCAIDSGCAELVFHTSVKGLLGEPERLSPSTSQQIGGTIAIERFEPMDFQLGSDSFNSEYPVACCDLTHVREAGGVDIEGLIGLPFFHSHIVRIDLDRRQLQILPTSSSPSQEWGTPVTLFEEHGRAKIDIEVGEGEKIRFSIDTGDTGSLSIPSNLFSRLMKTNVISKVRDSSAVFIAGFVRERDGILSNVRIGDFEIHDLNVDDGQNECSLGMRCLSRFRVTFDLPNGRLYLAKSDRFNKPDRMERVGIFLLRREGRTLVGYVRKGSAAEDAGVCVDDELIAIAHVAVTGMRLADVNWELGGLSESNDPCELQLRRAGVVMSVVVTPHE